MTTTVARTPTQAHGPRWALLTIAMACAVAAAGVLAVTRQTADEPARPAAPSALQQPAAPGGVIAYQVTGKGTFLARAGGEPLGPSEHEHAFTRAPADGARSPDGSAVATIDRNTNGVFLNVVRGGVGLSPVQLAGPDAPTLVDGGKGLAAAAKGVPLVLAWSPDSQALAYGSITGEPYVLHVLARGGVRNIQVSGGYVGELAWSPDGRHLAISTYALDRKDHTVLLLGAGESVARRVSDGCHIVWSPGSRHIAIHRDPRSESGAWVLAVDGSERYAITSEPEAFPLTWTES